MLQGSVVGVYAADHNLIIAEPRREWAISTVEKHCLAVQPGCDVATGPPLLPKGVHCIRHLRYCLSSMLFVPSPLLIPHVTHLLSALKPTGLNLYLYTCMYVFVLVLVLVHITRSKTTFIKFLLGQDYPGLHIGPEPTTDRWGHAWHTHTVRRGAALPPHTHMSIRYNCSWCLAYLTLCVRMCVWVCRCGCARARVFGVLS